MDQSSQTNIFLPKFAASNVKTLEEFTRMQADAAQRLIDRMQAEAKLTSELSTKLTEARSIPEAAVAWQGWAIQRMQMAAMDAKALLTETQKLMESGARLLSNGWAKPNGQGSTPQDDE